MYIGYWKRYKYRRMCYWGSKKYRDIWQDVVVYVPIFIRSNICQQEKDQLSANQVILEVKSMPCLFIEILEKIQIF